MPCQLPIIFNHAFIMFQINEEGKMKQGTQGKGRLCQILDTATAWQEIVEVPQVVVEERVVHVPGSFASPSGSR